MMSRDRHYTINASCIIEDRIRSTDLYRIMIREIVEHVRAERNGKTVEEMPALGGLTEMIQRRTAAVLAAHPEADENLGSKMIPRTVADEVRMMSRHLYNDIVAPTRQA